MTYAQREAMSLLQGDSGAPAVDMGPAARGTDRGMRPAPKPDDVAASDLRSDYGKHDVRRTVQGRNDSITTPDAREARDARAQREDPIKNDPIAGAIVQGIPAAGAGALAGAASRALAPAAPLLSRTVQAATTGAVSNPDHPVIGAATGVASQAIPLARGAADAAGEAALNRVTSPTFGQGPGKLAKAVGAGIGATVGGKVAGGAGAVAGGAAGSAVPTMVSKGVDRLAQRLAERHMARMAAMRTAASEAAPSVSVPAPKPTAPGPIAAPSRDMARGPNGPIGPNEFDALDEPGAPAGNHATVGGATNAGSRMSPAERGAAQGSLEDQLARSVEIMGDLRVAQKTGTMTPDLVQKALDAGISPTAVYHVIGNKAAANVALKKAITGE